VWSVFSLVEAVILRRAVAPQQRASRVGGRNGVAAAIPVFSKGMDHEAQLGFGEFALLEQPGFAVGRATAAS